MKIAILTQPLHINYGGNLQNFALQRIFKDLGHQPVTIDRHITPKLRARLKLGYFKRMLFFFLGRCDKPSFKSYLSKPHDGYVNEEITRFIDANINKTARLYSDTQVHKEFRNNQFDVVVVGSDQCWRPVYSPSIYIYFLDFLIKDKHIKKIAYAASFGTDEWEFTADQTKRCKKLIQQFDVVTVREKSSINLIKEKFNKESELVIDPTLLLTKNDYIQIIKAQNLPCNKGLYTYILDKADWKNKVVEIAKDKLGLNQYSSQHDENNLSQQKIPSIESWLKGFYDADFIITDSYHGTIFSILFNKPFISLVNIDRGKARFESLLYEFNLLERLVDGCEYFNIINLCNNINYKPINEIISEKSIYSINILKKIINNQNVK